MRHNSETGNITPLFDKDIRRNRPTRLLRLYSIGREIIDMNKTQNQRFIDDSSPVILETIYQIYSDFGASPPWKNNLLEIPTREKENGLDVTWQIERDDPDTIISLSRTVLLFSEALGTTDQYTYSKKEGSLLYTLSSGKGLGRQIRYPDLRAIPYAQQMVDTFIKFN